MSASFRVGIVLTMSMSASLLAAVRIRVRFGSTLEDVCTNTEDPLKSCLA